MPSYVKRAGRPNTGSKKRIGPNKWEVVVSDGFREDGERRQIRRRVDGTEADADRMIEEIHAAITISP